MSTFFTLFPNFTYNPNATNDEEFERLRRAEGWDPSSPVFRYQFKAFRTALVKHTGAAVDRFFITEYPSSSFNYRPNAPPWEEFRRLMECPGVAVGRSEQERAKARFTAVFNEAFNREIDKFFRKYETFNYNPRAEPKAEFERLRHFNRWIFMYNEWRTAERMQYNIARNEFFTAFKDDFTFFFGVGEDMRDWEYLCDLLHISPLPKTPEGCQVALESYYVNIFDLYDHVQRGTRLNFRISVEDLAEYSVRTSRVFPRDLAVTTCMKVLLRRFGETEGVPPERPWSGVMKVDKRRRRSKE